jgi:P-type Mg2+ transporter
MAMPQDSVGPKTSANAAPWWITTPSEYTAKTASLGLSSTEALERIRNFGPNTLSSHQGPSLIRQFLARFKNPLVVVLLLASSVSVLTGEITNFIIISGIVLLSVTLDFVQEFRANAAADKLRQSVSVRTTVLRDGQSVEIPVRDVVPGDVVLLSAGSLVPADALVLEANDFFVNQSLLTGEAYPVEKHPSTLLPTSTDLQEASNAVFMGTSVIGGSARVWVVKTGTQTAMGDIADSIQKPTPATSFEIGTRRFGMLIMRLTVVLVLFVLLVNAWFHKPWLESFLFAVALAVGLTPELLPMVVSVTLSRGAIRLAKLQMIVKRQTAIQDLGSMDVLCTDKTGTLTEAKIRLERHLDLSGQDSPRVLELAYINSFFETGLKSPLDEAILNHQTIDVSAWQKIDEIPFDFERRCVSVLVDNGTQRWLVAKGAAEDIVRLCTHVEINAEGCIAPSEVNDARLQAIRDRYHALESDGLRVLGVAWREVPRDHAMAVVNDESALVLAGFAAFLDPPKESAAPALAKLQQAGVTIKVVTGDSDLVTRHVCAQLNIEVTGVLTGKEIAQLDNQALQRRVETANLFCRVNPGQKQRVILALKGNGHVVGYMGDGINDAPSLHAADVGLSVDSAVDVAKAAADIIMLKQDLNVLHAGVLEGRRTFGNIMKYIMMGTSSNFGNMFSMAGAALFLPFLPMLPTQILLNNILYDISEIPIPLDEVDAQETAKPRVLDLDFIRNFMLVIGSISSVFDFLTFYVLLEVLKAEEQLFQTGWFVESLCTQVLVIFIIRTRGNPLKSKPHPLLAFTSIAVVATAIVLPLTPLGSHLGFVAPPAYFYGILGAMVVTYLGVVEVVKRIFYQRALTHQ